MQSKLELILFDVDGTLIDSFDAYQKIMQAVLPSYGIHVSLPMLRQSFAMPVDQALTFLQVSPDKFQAIEQAYGELEGTPQFSEPLFPGILRVLQQCYEAGIPLGIVTSRSRADLKSVDPAVLRMMTVVVTADETHMHKPDPAPLNLAIAKADSAHRKTVYIGDDRVDEQAARAAGIQFKAAVWGAKDLREFDQATTILRHPAELVALL